MKALPAALAFVFASVSSIPAWALPEGAQIASGAASLNQVGNALTITNSANAILNWQKFSISANELVRFQQPSASSSVLNRVVTQNPSAIFGQLLSNGHVWLVNPAGILVGAGATIDTAGFVASTLNISNADFLAGRLLFSKDIATPGSLVNQGIITTPSGGSVYLIGANVTNTGIITTPQGESILAAGQTVSLVDTATPGVKVDITGDGTTTNLGSILSEAGRIGIAGGLVTNQGHVSADSVVSQGGRVFLRTHNLLNSGSLTASGVGGGQVNIEASGSVIQTASAELRADGGSGAGGNVNMIASSNGSIFSSATMSATGATGGNIGVTAGDVKLYAANIDASGSAAGGVIHIGGGWQGSGALPHASTLVVNPSSELHADASVNGNGGEVVVWSDSATRFGGLATAKGGANGGDGGRIEVSSKNDLTFSGLGNASAPKGKAGSLLLDPKNIIINSSATGTAVGGVSTFELVNPNPQPGDQYGYSVNVLENNGNVVVTAPYNSFGGFQAGMVYLFDGSTNAVKSALWGTAYAKLGEELSIFGPQAIVPLKGIGKGNFVVSSANAYDPTGQLPAVGSVTWVNGTSGLNGQVSTANSLMGTSVGDTVGSWVLPSTDGNYVVASNIPLAGGSYALTWMNGGTGQTLLGNSYAINTSNSIVGVASSLQQPGYFSFRLITQLPVNENLVVRDSDGYTWVNVNQRTGFTDPSTRIGGDLVPLTNGNYVVHSRVGADVRGYATWVNGTSGRTRNSSNVVSGANSLVGTSRTFTGASGLYSVDDEVNGVVALANGNYVVVSKFGTSYADTGQGFNRAATWGNGNAGTVGVLDPATSLVGLVGQLAYGGAPAVFPLTSGAYVVSTGAGARTSSATTWVDGSGRTMNGQNTVSEANSLLTDSGMDPYVTALNNGNYVVSDPYWNAGLGAVTLGDGRIGTAGIVTPANSVVGTRAGYLAGDLVGCGWCLVAGPEGSVIGLTNGNYVIVSSNWNSMRGAVTFVDGRTGRVSDYAANGNTNVVSAANSLVGAAAYDQVGSIVDQSASLSGVLSVTPLANGNYVVASPSWNDGRGAVTWGDGTTGVSGIISSSNSLVGTRPGDNVGVYRYGGYLNYRNYPVMRCYQYGCGVNRPVVVALASGDYWVASPLWNGNAGAVTWGNGATGTTGEISAANSAWGSTGDRLGSGPVVPFGASSVIAGSPGFGGRTFAFSPGLISVPTPLPGGFATDPNTEVTVSTATLTASLNNGTQVTLQANNDIRLELNSPILTSGNGALALHAGRSILLNSNITTANGALTLVANETSAIPNSVIPAYRDPGFAVITQLPGAAISTGSGAISIAIADGAGRSGAQAATGDITLTSISTTGALTVRNSGPDAGGIVFGGDLRAGSATLVADRMNLAGGTIQASTGPVMLQQKSLGTSIRLGADAADGTGVLGIDQTELSNIQSANGLVIGSSDAGTTGGINVVGAATLSGTNLSGGSLTLQSDSGDIAFGVTGALSTAGRAVTLSTPGGAILGNSGATMNVSGSSLAANANKGITLTTSVATLNANNIGTSAAGSVNIENAQALNVTGVANAANGGAITVVANGAGNDLSISGTVSGTGAARIALTAGRDIQGGAAAGNDVVTAGVLIANAGRGIGTTNALRTSTGSSGTLNLTADGTGAAASIFVVEANALATSRVTVGGAGATTGRAVGLTSSALTIDTNFGALGDSLVLRASAQDISRSGVFTLTGSSVDLEAATGIGSLLAPLQTAAATVSAVNAGSTGSVVITNAGNVSVSGGNTGVGAFNAAATGAGKTLTVNAGNINAHAGSVTLTGDVLALQGTVTGDGGVMLKPYTTGAVIGVENTAQAFNVTSAMLEQVTSSTGVTVGASANTGGIVARGDNAISTGLSLALLTGGSIQLADNAARHTNGIAAKSLALTADADHNGSGSIRQSANNSGRLSASEGSLSLAAAQGIGSTATPILTSAASIDATNTASGDVAISSATAAAVTGSNSGGGVFDVVLDAGRLLSIGGGGIASNGGAVNLTADQMAINGAVSAGTGLMTVRPVTMTGTLIKIGGAASDETGVLAINSTEAGKFAGTGGLTILSTGTDGFQLAGAAPFANVTAGKVMLTTGGAITSMQTGTELISTGGAGLALNAVSGIGTIVANTGINIGAVGTVEAINATRGDMFLNFNGVSTINLGSAASSISQFPGGNLRFDAGGPMQITGDMSAGSGSITLNPTGALTRTGGMLLAANINLGTKGVTTSVGATGAGRIMVAGIGSSAPTVSAKATTGGVFFEQASGDMATGGYKLDVSANGQTIELATTSGKITVDHNYTADWSSNTQNDDLKLIAQGVGKDIVGNGTATLTTSGSVTLNASGGIGTTSALRTATTGNIGLAATGIAAAGDITLVETANAIDTNQITSLATDASTQAVSITAPSITLGTGGFGSSSDNIILTASSGSIAGSAGIAIAKNLTLNAVTGIGNIATNTGINIGSVSGSIAATNTTSGDMFLKFTSTGRTSVGGPSGISQFSGGNLRFDSGGLMEIAGDISAGAGSLTLNPIGALVRSAGTLTADIINLGTAGRTTSIGATGAGRIQVAGSTAAPTVTVGATRGGVFVEQTSRDLLTSKYVLDAAGFPSRAELATTSGKITVDGDLGAFALTVSASGGDIVGGAGVLGADDLVLNASGGIGIGLPVKMDGLRTLSLTTGGAGALGNIDVRSVNSLDIGRIAISTNPAVPSVNPTVQSVSLGSDASIFVNAGIIAAGDLKLRADGDIKVARAITVGNDLSLTAGKDVIVTDSIVSAGNTVSAAAANLVVASRNGPAQLIGNKGASVAVGGTTTLHGGYNNGAFAEISGGATGALSINTDDLLLHGGGPPGAYARLLGNPDVTLKINGRIIMDAGLFNGGYAGIGSVLPATIYINFPQRFSGGYFVNGVESVVFDPTTSSGFVAGGRPAVLGQNLIVTYGGFPQSSVLNVPLAVSSAMNQVVTSIASIRWPGSNDHGYPAGNSGAASADAVASCSDGSGVPVSGMCIIR